MTVELVAASARDAVGPGMASRRIFGSTDGSWARPVFMEWELTGAAWTDLHPHDEFNFVLEGELHVHSDGVTVVAGVGDLVRVVAHTTARYVAPVHARMLAVYDHNPDGAPSTISGLEQIDP
jgi:ethanolamine utilization protein EutQ (cupin superfamily)